MTAISRILLATEFADSCTRACAHAAALAGRTGAELHLLHVQVLHGDQYGWAGIPNIEAVETAITKTAARNLNDFAAGLDHPAIQAVERDVTPAPAILRYAGEHDIDLIVIGTHARSGLSRLFMGSTAAEVVRQAEVPVLVVGPEHAEAPDSYRRVLVPVDFSGQSTAALRQGAEIALLHRAQLDVVHVVDTRPLPPYSTESFAEAERDRARDALQDLVKNAHLAMDPEIQIATGLPSSRIVETARELGTDLIVIGRSGLSALDRLLLGSTTDRVLRSAPCPVLTACQSSVVDI